MHKSVPPCWALLRHTSLLLLHLLLQTLLNSILTKDHGKRVAVIENEVRACGM